jgi:Peptidase family M48
MSRRTILFALCFLMTTVFSGCAALRNIAANFYSTEHFVALAEDARIRYEPSTEATLALARLVQPHLHDAIAQVEAAHDRPFRKPVIVHICATPQSFAHFTGMTERMRGAVHPGLGLFLNPVLLEREAGVRAILIHELSHLHMNQQQRMNFVDMPSWFNEGLATFVSQGGGAEFAPEAEARKLIAAGKIFTPHERGSSLALDQSGVLATLGLSNASHMFYRQSMLFIAFLKQRDENRFKQFLLNLQDGEFFSPAFWQAFGGDVKTLQGEFIAWAGKP